MSRKTKRTSGNCNQSSNKAVKSAAASATASMFEALEDRKLFSVLTLNGTAGDDVIRLSQRGPLLTVSLNQSVKSFRAMRLDGVVVNGLDGNDVIRAVAGFNIPLTLNGGAGNDQLAGGRAADHLNGGDGNDFLFPSPGADDFDGGAGVDTADYSVYTASVNVTLDDAANDGAAGADSECGGAGNDVIYGGTGDDNLNGQEGDDKVYGNYGPRATIYYLNPLPVVNLASVNDCASNTLLTGAAGVTISPTLPIEPIVPIINPLPI